MVYTTAMKGAWGHAHKNHLLGNSSPKDSPAKDEKKKDDCICIVILAMNIFCNWIHVYFKVWLVIFFLENKDNMLLITFLDTNQDIEKRRVGIFSTITSEHLTSASLL